MDKAVKKAGLTEFSEPLPESEVLPTAPDIDPLFRFLKNLWILKFLWNRKITGNRTQRLPENLFWNGVRNTSWPAVFFMERKRESRIFRKLLTLYFEKPKKEMCWLWTI